MKKLTGKDNGTAVCLNIGDEFEISLDEIPTTGYLWLIKVIPDGTVLKNEETLTKSEFPGAASKKAFQFEVLDNTNGCLVINKVRPWDTEDCIETFQIEIRI